MNTFYVYLYFRPWNGEPCYVGKGHDDRDVHHEKVGGAHPNKHFANIFKKAKRLGLVLPIVRVRENLSEEDAYATEIALIAAIGRQEFGGPLVNLTDGGEGLRNPSQDARNRIAAATSKRAKGDGNPFFGKTHSEETKQKNRDAHLGKPSPMKGITGSAHHWWGKKHSDETKRKIGAGNKGKVVSDNTKALLSVVISKIMQDPEVKERHLLAQRARRIREKQEKECLRSI